MNRGFAVVRKNDEIITPDLQIKKNEKFLIEFSKDKTAAKKIWMLIFFLFSFLFFKDLIAYDFPKIYGCFCEGGIITGKIDPSEKVKING